jgi:hypothetical protein
VDKLSVDEALALATAGLEDPCFFMRSFFPQWFSFPMPWVHRGVLAILSRQTDWLLKFGEEIWPGGKGVWNEQQLDKILRHFVWRSDPEDSTSPLVPLFEAERSADGTIGRLNLAVSDRMLIIMPRGVSKTTLLNAHNIREILNHEISFLVYLSETATHAEQQLENIKRTLETNALIQAVYGLKRPERSSIERWTQSLIETTDGVVVAAKGRGGQVRGMNHQGKRPDSIVFDDIEDKESVKTEEQRDKTRTWLKADVEPALPQIKKGVGRIVGLGTVLHHDSLLLTLSRDPEWVTVRFGAVDPEGDMLWNHYMTKEQFYAKRRSFQRIGKLAEFNMEYQSSTKSEGDNSKFPSAFTYQHEELTGLPGRAIVIDPAISDKKDSDYCAFGVVGMTEKGKIHVLDVYMERGMSPQQQVDKYFELKFKWDCNKHGVESVAYQLALIHLLREEMFRRGKSMGPSSYFEIEPITHGRTGKTERVEGILSTRYTAGYITHERHFPLYEEQLLDWPNGKKDGPDVVAMAVQLLDPFAAYAFDPESEDADKLAKDQFEPLDEFLDEYRMCP